MGSRSAFSPEIMWEDLVINPGDVVITQSDFIQRVVVKVKELKDRVTDTKTMYEEERIRSRRVIENLRSDQCRIPNFPDASFVPGRKSTDGDDSDFHLKHYVNLTKMRRFLEVVHKSEKRYEKGRCIQTFEDKILKIRDIIEEMKSYLGKKGLTLEDIDSESVEDKMSLGDVLETLQSREESSDRFHRDYLILKEVETYCEEMLSAYNTFSSGGMDGYMRKTHEA